MEVIYRAVIRIYFRGIIWISKLGSAKAVRYLRAQEKHHFAHLKIPPKQSKRAWFHAASAGEWLQLAPLADQMKNDGWDIVVSFFSPSAIPFLEKGHYPFFMLPPDDRSMAGQMTDAIQPDIFITARNELWMYLLQAFHKKSTPVVLLNAYTPTNISSMKKWWWRFFAPYITVACCLDVHTAGQLQKWGVKRVPVTGDTKFEAASHKPVPTKDLELEHFLSGKKVVIAGSMHEPELNWLSRFLREHKSDHSGWYWLIVPHDLTQNGFEAFRESVGLPVTHYKGTWLNDPFPIIYINVIGMLAGMYTFSEMAIVGGGWSAGTHNVIEPAIQGNAIIIGPRHTAFAEATELVKIKGAVSAESYVDFESTLLLWLGNEEKRHLSGKISKEYALSRSGATDRCYSEIKMLLQ